MPGYANDDPYLSVCVRNHSSEVTLLLGLLEKAIVKHLCDGDYSGLNKLTIIDVLRALLGPQVAMDLVSHDVSSSVWRDIKQGLETNNVVYATTSTGGARTLIIENCFEF